MSRRSCAAFTLVELLVVITVIAMLMALLIPAANMFIEKAKQTQCLNNLHEIGLACQTYEGSKQHFPPESSNMNVNGAVISWASMLTSNLGRGDLGVGQPVYMPVFVCPSNPPDTFDDAAPALSYACNAGKKNSGGSGTMPSDWKDNGVFMELKKNQLVENVTKDFIFSHDGLQTTLLVMETLNSGSWAVSGPATETLTGMVWPHSKSGASSDDTRVNDPVVLKSPGSFPYSTIASKHPGGANVVFCDSHSLFISENVDPVMIEYLMTPNGKGVKNPGSPTIVGQTVKMANGKTTISEADLIQ